MIEPTTLTDLIDVDHVSVATLAITATIDAQIAGLTVRSHPGKLDIYDVVSRDLIRARACFLVGPKSRPCGKQPGTTPCRSTSPRTSSLKTSRTNSAAGGYRGNRCQCNRHPAACNPQ